jgi:hypothetical protein
MSLLHELKTNTKLKELIDIHLKIKGRDLKRTPARTIDRTLSSSQRSLLGTAYDYMLRWHLETPYIKNMHFEELIVYISQNSVAVNGLKTFIRNNEESHNAYKLGAAVSHFKAIVVEIANFIKHGMNEERYLVSLHQLYAYDATYRSGKSEYVDKVMKNTTYRHLKTMDELREMRAVMLKSDIVKEYLNTSDKYLNPSFGNSHLLGGADADLIIGDRLVEIKATMESVVQKSHLRQLVGYAILSKLDGLEIEEISIYFPEYDFEEVMNLSDVVNDMDELTEQVQALYHLKNSRTIETPPLPFSR